MDYKEFVSAYGPCEIFGDLWVWHPRADVLNLPAAMDRVLSEAEFMRSQFPESYPYALHPDPNGLIPVAETEAGAIVYLAPPGPDRENWATVVGWRSSWSYHDYGFCEFLLKALTNDLEEPFFHESILEDPGARYQVVGQLS